jgi:hypothetical protein
MDTRRIPRSDKTIGPEVIPGDKPVRDFVLTPDAEAFRPAPGTDIVDQVDLKSLADDEEHLAYLEVAIKDRRDKIIARLRAGGVVAPGAYTASVKTNMKPQTVRWKEAFINAMGEAEAKLVEASAKGGPREVSSYTLDFKKVGG